MSDYSAISLALMFISCSTTSISFGDSMITCYFITNGFFGFSNLFTFSAFYGAGTLLFLMTGLIILFLALYF